VAAAFKRMKLNVGEMHSDLDQAQRDVVMHEFKSGRIDILVATDIVSRGIDIDDIRLVINYDVPRDCEDYVHRIGRTARAGAEGCAITFVSVDDQSRFAAIEEFIERDVFKLPVPEELGEAPAYEPKKSGGKGGKGRGKGGKNHGRGRGGNHGGKNRRGGKGGKAGEANVNKCGK
jgi:superfamily II DNA/RNA helicase